MNIGSVRLEEVLDGAAHRVTPWLAQTRHTLDVHSPPSDIRVMADASRIQQVLHNLIDNALRYSRPRTTIEVRGKFEGQQAIISVRDQGHGIRAQELERIFEPFYRGQSTKRRGVDGVGIGLAICRGIVESHGGELWVESKAGQGSTFSFTLPLAPPVGADYTN